MSMPWLTRAHRPFCSYLRKYMAKACSKVLTNWSGCVEYVCMNESGVSSWGIPSKLYGQCSASYLSHLWR